MTERDEHAHRASARVGTFLKGKWHIDNVLGIGGMATVYAGTHKNQKRVAIKMLHPELSHDPTIRERFLREGYAANTVRHRGAVEVLDEDVTDDGLAFLVMELLEGESFEDRRMRKGGRLAVEDVLALTDQLLEVLAAAHEKGIVHRDLKPENLFYTRDRVVKVLDFGIARIRQEGSEGGGGTRAGLVMGTPAFMAPEQARGRWDLVDQQTDVWAVGATMYTLLTGHPVRDADTANEELALAITRPVPSIETVIPDLPPPVVLLVDKALAYDKTDRWSDALAMQAALRDVYASIRAAPPSDVAAGAPAPRPSLPSLSSVSAAGTAPGRHSGSLPGTGPANFSSPTLVEAAAGKSTGAGGARSRVGIAVGAGVAAVVLVAIAVVRLAGSGGDAHPASADRAPPSQPSTSALVAPQVGATPPVVTPLQEASAAPPQASASPPVSPPGPSSKPSGASAPAKAPSSPSPVSLPAAAPAAKPPAARKTDPFSRRD